MSSTPVFVFILLAACGALAAVVPASGDDATHTPPAFDRLVERAAEQARQPYASPDASLPGELSELDDYDKVRAIQAPFDRMLWHDEQGIGWRLGFHHRTARTPGHVKVYIVDENDGPRPVNFSTDYFKYAGDYQPGDLSVDLGFSGIRLLRDDRDGNPPREVVTFQGATYFRMVGRDQAWGSSARALSINLGNRDGGEEFPAFTEFHVVKPAPGDDRVHVLAYMDSPSVTGAFAFAFAADDHTVADVHGRVFARTDVPHLGLAPLTSMYWYGPAQTRPADDFRPRVHDANGLQLWSANGERLWRPLLNPRHDNASTSLTSYLVDSKLNGFGLLQRPRAFDAYRDAEAHYGRRPSLWVTPGDDWPAGAVELFAFATDTEFDDNITAVWRPDASLNPDAPLSFAYTLATTADPTPGVERSIHTEWWGVEPRSGRRLIVDFIDEAGEVTPDVAVNAEADLDGRSIPAEAVLIVGEGRTRARAMIDVPEGADDEAVIRVFARVGQRVGETFVLPAGRVKP